jgi:hypothetical protein
MSSVTPNVPPPPAPGPHGPASPTYPLPQAPQFLQTSRTDGWWAQPVLVFGGFTLFVIYATWAALQGSYYFLRGDDLEYAVLRNYLSPFYAPTIFDAPGQYSGHAWFGEWPGWLGWVPPIFRTPALFILWIPVFFRGTCYFYRGAYYKAFWGDPMNCAVGEPGFRGRRYRGERWLPLVMQNAHRYSLYLALLLLIVLVYDTILAFIFFVPDETRVSGYRPTFGIGVGTLVLMLDVYLIAGYTFGCHSLRHLVGGRFDQMSRYPARKKAYDCVTCLNRRHMLWAWASMLWVGFTDLYIRMCAMGVWYDYQLL